MEHDLTSTMDPVQAIETHTDNRSLDVVAGVDPGDALVARKCQEHPFLQVCDEATRRSAVLVGDEAWRSVFLSSLAWVGYDELTRVCRDPEMAGLHVPPPSDAEKFLVEARKRGLALVPPPGMDVAEYAYSIKLRMELLPALSEQYLKAMMHRPDCDDKLVEFNRTYTFVKDVGGKVRIVWWQWHTNTQGDRFQALHMKSVAEFTKAEMNNFIVDESFHHKTGKWVRYARNAADYWLTHTERPSKDRLVFRPELPVADNEMNLWSGFAYTPLEGIDKIELYLRFIFEVICDSNHEVFEYVLDWMAAAVQRPYEPGQTAIVLQSDQGTGKGFFVRWFGKLFGRHFLASANAKFITGDFNAHLRYCTLLYADEAFFAGDRRQANSLKALLTEPTMNIEAKGVDAEQSDNCIHMIMASNEEHVARLDRSDRRYCVLKVNPAWTGCTDLFDQMEADLLDGGLRQLLGFLKERDISDWRAQPVPETVGRREQKAFTAEDTWDDVISAKVDDLLLAAMRTKNERWLHSDIEPKKGENWDSPEYEARLEGILAAQGVAAHSRVLLEMVGLSPDKQDTRAFERLRAVMKRLGWSFRENVKVAGRQGKGYVREAAQGGADWRLVHNDGVFIVNKK